MCEVVPNLGSVGIKRKINGLLDLWLHQLDCGAIHFEERVIILSISILVLEWISCRWLCGIRGSMGGRVAWMETGLLCLIIPRLTFKVRLMVRFGFSRKEGGYNLEDVKWWGWYGEEERVERINKKYVGVSHVKTQEEKKREEKKSGEN